MADLRELFEVDFPCDTCIIQTMCSKSFVDNTACEKLRDVVLKKLKKRYGKEEKKITKKDNSGQHKEKKRRKDKYVNRKTRTRRIKMLKRLKRNRGFTLIELIIVIAIVFILLAIGIPLLTSEKNELRQERTEETMKKETPKSDTQPDKPKYKPL